LDFVFFVGVIIMGIGLLIFGRGHWALGANAKNQFLTHWKLDYNMSL